jgi:phosphatidate cytidylyltransferase
MGMMSLSHPSPTPTTPTASWGRKRIIFLALLVLQQSSLLTNGASNHVNNSPLRSSNSNDRWLQQIPQSQSQHKPLHRVAKSTEGLLRQAQPDCPHDSCGDDSRIRIRGGGAKDPSSFQKRMIASILLLAGLSVVVSYGQEPGLQLLVWLLTPGLFNEATSIVQQATPTVAASGEVVLAPKADQEVSPEQVSDTTTPNTTVPDTAIADTATSTPNIATPDTAKATKKPFINKWWWFVTYTLGLSSKTNHLLQIPDSWLPSVHLASFGMIMGGLVQVVLQLNARGSDIADFERACEELAIAHLGIILTLVPATAWLSAVHLFGKEWVLYAAFLVVINDTAAYIFGKNFGKNALLPKISPNKTWEGWMGALVSTLILSFPLWKVLFQNVARYDRHAFVLALYCAVVAPFGGFLASTVKRAYGKKDFGSLIAGHGGLIDRLDCQLVTAPFVYLYLTAVKVKVSPY